MNDAGLQIRCQRCGTQMEMRDPGPGMPWTPDQFWVCGKCGRHFWSTYPPPNREKAKPAAEAKPAVAASPAAAAAAKPAAEAKPVAAKATSEVGS